MSNVVNPSGEVAAAKEKPRMPISGILVLVFVAIAVVLIPLELRARSGQNRTREAVQAAWDTAKARGDYLSKKDLFKCLHGSFAREKTPKGERFVWQGVLQAYPMQVEYRAGGVVQRVIWN